MLAHCKQESCVTKQGKPISKLSIVHGAAVLQCVAHIVKVSFFLQVIINTSINNNTEKKVLRITKLFKNKLKLFFLCMLNNDDG